MMLSNKETIIAGAGIGVTFLLSNENRFRNTLIATAIAGGGIYLGRTLVDDAQPSTPALSFDQPPPAILPPQRVDPVMAPSNPPVLPIGIDADPNPITISNNPVSSAVSDLVSRVVEALTPAPSYQSTATTIVPDTTPIPIASTMPVNSGPSIADIPIPVPPPPPPMSRFGYASTY